MLVLQNSWDERDTCPPATKCAHDFATGAGLAANEAAYFCGMELAALGSDARPSSDPSSGLLRASEGGSIEVFMEDVEKRMYKKNVCLA